MQTRTLLLAAAATLALTPLASGVRAEDTASFCETQYSRECQEAVTPQQILERFRQGNARFASGHGTHRDYAQQVQDTAKGQYPLASVVSCIDSRAPAELILDQGIGDIFNARVAGNVINEDILGSLEFASKVAGAKLIVVMGHTSCGAVKGACDNVQLGNLTALLAKIQPAVATVPSKTGADRSSKNYEFVEHVAAANVRQSVQQIRDHSPLLKAMEDKGEIKIVGAMYDVATGKVSWYD
jgi:carbonic anhydrase